MSQSSTPAVKSATVSMGSESVNDNPKSDVRLTRCVARRSQVGIAAFPLRATPPFLRLIRGVAPRNNLGPFRAVANWQPSDFEPSTATSFSFQADEFSTPVKSIGGQGTPGRIAHSPTPFTSPGATISLLEQALSEFAIRCQALESENDELLAREDIQLQQDQYWLNEQEEFKSLCRTKGEELRSAIAHEQEELQSLFRVKCEELSANTAQSDAMLDDMQEKTQIQAGQIKALEELVHDQLERNRELEADKRKEKRAKGQETEEMAKIKADFDALKGEKKSMEQEKKSMEQEKKLLEQRVAELEEQRKGKVWTGVLPHSVMSPAKIFTPITTQPSRQLIPLAPTKGLYNPSSPQTPLFGAGPRLSRIKATHGADGPYVSQENARPVHSAPQTQGNPVRRRRSMVGAEDGRTARGFTDNASVRNYEAKL